MSWHLIPLLLAAPSIQDPASIERFERDIRPLLVERCYRCHNSIDRRESGLALDHAEGLLEGGRRGPAIVPGSPENSLLLGVVRHDEGLPAMPEDEPVLEPSELAALEEWIRAGAPDPRLAAPTPEQYAEETSWEGIRERRLQWWSFQPLVAPALPRVVHEDRVLDDLDRFVLAGQEERGEEPAAELDRPALLRRASYVLTGLPPSKEQLEEFLADGESGAYERAVERLFSSPHHGERLARHWMDLVRYAETHGSEGDPGVPYAWRYRDYLVRAFEADVPWDRLVQEHVAGDLLEPRVDPETGIDEAQIGLGHLRFVQHGYGPTEPLVDQVQFIDNQIDVLGKSVLGLTVSCARCHDHKFDPVAQTDYFAWYGILASVRPAVRTVDSAERRREKVEELTARKAELRPLLAEAWLDALEDLPSRLTGNEEALEEARSAVEEGRPHPLGPLVHSLDAPEEQSSWWQSEVAGELALLEEPATAGTAPAWDLSGEDASDWYAHGSILDNHPAAPGSFAVLPEGDRVLTTLLPAGIYSHLVSDRHSGVLSSPAFDVDGGSIWIRAMGSGGARARYAMQLHPRVSGPVYRAHDLRAEQPRWYRWDMAYWEGDRAHVELATARDIPVEVRGDERSAIGLTEVRVVPPDEPEPRDSWDEWLAPLLAAGVDGSESTDELLDLHVQATRGALERWRDGQCDDGDVRFLDPLLRHGVLPVQLEELPGIAQLVEGYRELEQEVPVPVRAPGVLPGDRVDQPLFVRGDPEVLAEPVTQRFLEYVDPEPYGESARLEFARDLVDDEQPLAARMAANRIWCWVFGDGLVPGVDNLGLLGQEPADRELLDHLAVRLVEADWSVRSLLRALVTSHTFRQEMPPRRLDAESVRDSLLAVSGRLDGQRFGPPTGERSPRRSLYVSQRRTSMPAFLAAFDQPSPHTTVGRRATTDVPAQGLALLNDGLVLDCARSFAEAALRRDATDSERLGWMVSTALGREPGAEELRQLESFLLEQQSQLEELYLRRDQLERQVQQRSAEAADLVERGALLVQESRGETTAEPWPAPLALWEFEGDLRDELGELHGEAHGEVQLESGRLVLDGRGHVQTSALAHDLEERTLEAWVELAVLDQPGAGVLGVQTMDGDVFDTIVFAEREAGRWIAGSDHFRRTQDVGGEAELEPGRLVHVAVTYAADGEVQLYRDGLPYGSPYDSGELVEHRAGESHVLIGARHGVGSSPRGPLRAAIERARLHDRVLPAEEIAARVSGDPNHVSRSAAVGALTPGEQARIEELELELEELREERELLLPHLDGGDTRPWREVAHALFLLEEFRYLR